MIKLVSFSLYVAKTTSTLRFFIRFFIILDFSNMAEYSSEATPQVAIMCVFCVKRSGKWKCEECGHMCNVCKENNHRRLISSHKHKILSLKDIGKVATRFCSRYLQRMGIFQTCYRIYFSEMINIVVS